MNEPTCQSQQQRGTEIVALQIDVLAKSFDLVVIRGDDLTEEFYRRVFTRAPEIQPLFKHVSMSLQKLKFISTLIVLRKSLDDLEAALPQLEAMGARHAAYGAVPEHYPIIRAALLEAMAAVGGDRWTPAFTAAWDEAYLVVQEAMLRGAAVAQASVDSTEPGIENETGSAQAETEYETESAQAGIEYESA